MNDQKTKELLVSDLKELLSVLLEDAEKLTARAWNILQYTGTLFGIAIAIVSFNKDNLNISVFFVGLIAALVIFFRQIIFLREVVRTRKYIVPPGTPNSQFPYDAFQNAYVNISESEYLDQMIIDYAGTNEIPGAIQQAVEYNAQRSKCVDSMMNYLVWIIVTLFLSVGLSLLVSSI